MLITWPKMCWFLTEECVHSGVDLVPRPGHQEGAGPHPHPRQPQVPARRPEEAGDIIANMREQKEIFCCRLKLKMIRKIIKTKTEKSTIINLMHLQNSPWLLYSLLQLC